MCCFGLAFLLQQGGVLTEDATALLLCRCIVPTRRGSAKICFRGAKIAVCLIALTQLIVDHRPMPVGRAPFLGAGLYCFRHQDDLAVELLESFFLVIEGR